MSSQKFTDKVASLNNPFELKSKNYTSLSTYLKDHSKSFSDLINYYDENFSKGDALRLLNRVEREIGNITAVSNPEINDKGKVSHIKANFMHDYIREHLALVYVEKTFEYGNSGSKPIKLHDYHLIDALKDKFQLGDKMRNTGIGVIYKGENAKYLPEHVDIRDALDEHVWSKALYLGKQIVENFIQSKNKNI